MTRAYAMQRKEREKKKNDLMLKLVLKLIFCLGLATVDNQTNYQLYIHYVVQWTECTV